MARKRRALFGFNDPYDWLRDELNTFFSQRGGPGTTGSPTGTGWTSNREAGVFPPVNLYDDGESFLVRCELPGVSVDDLEVNAKGEQLTIRGERSIADVDTEANYHRRERESGTFRRAVTLPQAVNSKKVMANYKNGVLEIRAPRAEEAKARKIDIKA